MGGGCSSGRQITNKSLIQSLLLLLLSLLSLSSHSSLLLSKTSFLGSNTLFAKGKSFLLGQLCSIVSLVSRYKSRLLCSSLLLLLLGLGSHSSLLLSKAGFLGSKSSFAQRDTLFLGQLGGDVLLGSRQRGSSRLLRSSLLLLLLLLLSKTSLLGSNALFTKRKSFLLGQLSSSISLDRHNRQRGRSRLLCRSPLLHLLLVLLGLLLKVVFQEHTETGH